MSNDNISHFLFFLTFIIIITYSLYLFQFKLITNINIYTHIIFIVYNKKKKKKKKKGFINFFSYFLLRTISNKILI